MARLALGGKGGSPASPPATAGAGSPGRARGPSSEARAAAPRLTPVLAKKWRRVISRRCSLIGFMAVILVSRAEYRVLLSATQSPQWLARRIPPSPQAAIHG